jgi:putative transposase
VIATNPKIQGARHKSDNWLPKVVCIKHHQPKRWCLPCDSFGNARGSIGDWLQAYDFVAARTNDGIINEYTRECLAIKVARRLDSMDIIALADLFNG